MENILVNIVMLTYNQEKYVKQAIESVLAQQCAFNYQLIISDDCSTDNTAIICSEIAKLYPEKVIFQQNKKNLGLAINYKKAFDVCFAKYIAILEGDDYWTDEKKLEKQVNILESDENIGLVHASVRRFVEEKSRFIDDPEKLVEFKVKNQGYIYDVLIRENFIVSLTVLFRKKIFDEIIDYNYMIRKNYITIDYFIWLGLALNSKVFFIKDVVGIYRVHKKSISHKRGIAKWEKFLDTVQDLKEYYLKANPIPGYTAIESKLEIDRELFYLSIRQDNFPKAKQYRSKVKIESAKDIIYKIFSLNRILVWIASVILKLFRLRNF
jgi:glycosyltransferase involved in cell wall biosynthesis